MEIPLAGVHHLILFIVISSSETEQVKREKPTGKRPLKLHCLNNKPNVQIVVIDVADATNKLEACALALIVRHPVGAKAFGNDEMIVAGLVGMMCGGSPKVKENAVMALLELGRGMEQQQPIGS
ncbi:hypothetical protein AgCh_024512 [Apium graveolens]